MRIEEVEFLGGDNGISALPMVAALSIIVIGHVEKRIHLLIRKAKYVFFTIGIIGVGFLSFWEFPVREFVDGNHQTFAALATQFFIALIFGTLIGFLTLVTTATVGRSYSQSEAK